MRSNETKPNAVDSVCIGIDRTRTRDLSGTVNMELVKFSRTLCMLLGLIISISGEGDDDCQCGQTSPKRITGGNKGQLIDWPSTAGLFDTRNNIVFCGGLVISNKHILTAAHCVEAFGRNPNLLRVIAGKKKAKKSSEDTMFYRVAKIVSHPDYKETLYNNDIAIVSTKGEISLPTGTSPVCLPFNYKNDKFLGEKVSAVGWNSPSRKGQPPTSLQRVYMSVVSPEECLKRNSDLKEDGILCANSEQEGPCDDDEGDPVYWRHGTSKKLMGVGVIADPGCGTDTTISVAIADYLDFIESNTDGYKFCKAS